MKHNNTLASSTDNAPLIERLVFGNRPLVLIIFALLTLYFGYHVMQMRPVASFERMIPIYHEYIQANQKHSDKLKGLSNTVRIVVETTEGDIFTKEYIETLREVHDATFFLRGVDRQNMISLWASAVRYTEVTEEGFTGDTVMPNGFDGSEASLQQLKKNIQTAGLVGSMVANDFKSTTLIVPLVEYDTEAKKPLDYHEFSGALEEQIRDRFQNEKIKIRIIGFAKLVGDLIDGAILVGFFFLIAFVILLALLWVNSRCWRSTLSRAVSSIIAVVLQMGILHALGFGLNPYSMLVPFLMFALGVSHGIQMFNAVVHELMAGQDKLTAVRRAYRAVYLPGLSALFTDGVGFALLFIIAIGVIQDIAVGATIGVAVVALCDLCLLPVLMSYTGVSRRAVNKLEKIEEEESSVLWTKIAQVTKRPYAIAVLAGTAVLFAGASYVRMDLKIGDLDPGAPELRPDSRYNIDNAYIIDHYSTSSDLFVVMVESPKDKCTDYRTLVEIDRLQWQLRNTPGVQSTQSIADFTKNFNAGMSEGSLKAKTLSRSDQFLGYTATRAKPEWTTIDCNFSPIKVYLTDHKAETLDRVVAVVEAFNETVDLDGVNFLLAAGNAGIEAATNHEVENAHLLTTWVVYITVIMVCIITFRSVRAAICIVVPLYITSVLCEALMTKMGIGIKVATLPVIAVGVGIGIDYGIYIYSKMKEWLDKGYDVHRAYIETLKTTGRAVAFTGVTLGVGVATWTFSPIKFQADMGLLLTFMFVWNMVGALLVLPALAYFLVKPRAKGSETQPEGAGESEEVGLAHEGPLAHPASKAS
ncbi:efflux RND transporter permease subunit [Aestuariirhabdus litorea]|uniref:RND family transporter n=1 Tax=Aestuariirhabdus litorea TaxID=2528527 RepID=A0A3P3VJ72_9GAMM|nr:MMPL family transporter [Aestuariirhabdus litorea]RRJ82404.1 RND family transporter [Aestuariirhabdus litorea]RWW92567.1 RND family transporter [Endozoicomonadaceae bacterium GTF-13]